jgi:hypothetical protein
MKRMANVMRLHPVRHVLEQAPVMLHDRRNELHPLRHEAVTSTS